MKSGDNVDENISAASVINAEGNGHSSEMGIMYEDSMNFSMYESNSNSISLHDTSKTSVGHPLNVSYLSCFKAWVATTTMNHFLGRLISFFSSFANGRNHNISSYAEKNVYREKMVKEVEQTIAIVSTICKI